MSKKSKRRMRKRRRIENRMQIRAAEVPSQLVIEANGTVQIEAAAEEGKLPTFSMTAYTGGAMVPRGFSESVVVDLEGMTVAAGSRPILLGHDPSNIVGHTTDIDVDSQVSVSGIISGTGAAANEVVASSKNGFPWRASIGASVHRMEEVEAGTTVKVNGKSFRGPLLVARETTLSEVSFVPIGADNDTSARVAASAGNGTEEKKMDFQQWVEAQGFTYDELSDTQRKTLKAAYDAAQASEPAESQNGRREQSQVVAEANQTVEDIRAQLRQEAAAERTRTSAINRVCAEFDSPQIEVDGEKLDLAAHAIAEGWSAEKTELHALRASRSAAPAVHTKSHESDCTLEAMQAAMMLNSGLELDSPIFASRQAVAMGLPKFMRKSINDDERQRYMEAAHRFSDMSMLDIACEAIRLDNRTVPHGRQSKIEAAFSGTSLDSIFTQSISANLLQAYMQSADSTGSWTNSVDVPDFKTNERELVSTMGGLQKLPRGQEADHADRSDVEETYKIGRYAKQFVVDEQDMIDDRLDVFRTTPQQFGMAAARLRPDLVYYILLNNANLADGTALFASGHNNVQTSSALTEANLRSGIALIELQQDNSVNLNLRVTHVIVPSDLKHTAANLIDSPMLVYGADDETRIGSTNTLSTQEQITVVADARLSNGVTDPDSGTTASGSTTQWYLASTQGHTIEVGYLRGTGRAPTVRSERLTQGKWGISWDVKMDIGAKALDYRALARSTA